MPRAAGHRRGDNGSEAASGFGLFPPAEGPAMAGRLRPFATRELRCILESNESARREGGPASPSTRHSAGASR
jgi:hypothetical protein